MNHKPWAVIFDKYKICHHNFDKEPYFITAKQIKEAVKDFERTNEKEVRILCKQDSREDRPKVFVDRNVFLLPVKNGIYALVKGDGYVDIPEIEGATRVYVSKVDFPLDTSQIGNSEMQHLDFAYAVSLIRCFLGDDTLLLTIRGRKYTPQFSFRVGRHEIKINGIQTEVDAGYEGRNQVALVEAKNSETNNIIIRQLFYPLRQWAQHTDKAVKTLFFEKRGKYYHLWQFEFRDINDSVLS